MSTMTVLPLSAPGKAPAAAPAAAVARLLLVDDDRMLTLLLKDYLVQEGFAVDVVHDGADGVAQALDGDYALVVLDVMLPRLDGHEVLRRIRRRSQVPVLMLSASDDQDDRIVGLEELADDYVAKPCSPRELTARVRAILRRARPGLAALQPTEILRVGPLVIWPELRRAELLGQELALTPTEFNLLQVLAADAGRVVSKEQLSRRALGRAVGPYDRSIDVHLCAVRQKLGPRADGHARICAVRGVGYQLVREFH